MEGKKGEVVQHVSKNSVNIFVEYIYIYIYI